MQIDMYNSYKSVSCLCCPKLLFDVGIPEITILGLFAMIDTHVEYIYVVSVIISIT